MAAQASAVIDFDKNGGVIPVIAQDYRNHRVLMLAYMNREAFEETVATRRACYFSRSRNRLWRKGEESGNFQIVHEIRLDCDEDAVLLMVEQAGDGAACHEGYESDYYRVLDGEDWRVVDKRIVDPAKYGPNYGHPKKPVA
jgi:phosphoribosyl-AMP cyclohydrolase